MADYKYLGTKTENGEITLCVATQGGTVRKVPLNERQALFAIKELSDALIEFQSKRAVVAYPSPAANRPEGTPNQ